jgi:serine phosphatase RsbU (regulator of sigma subunit)
LLKVFCTDGIFEAEDPSGQMLGEAAVVEVIRRNVGGTAREVVDSVFEAVRQFQQSERPGDDMTVVAVKVQTG